MMSILQMLINSTPQHVDDKKTGIILFVMIINYPGTEIIYNFPPVVPIWCEI